MSMFSNLLILSIAVPFAAGLLCLLLPGNIKQMRGFVAVVAAAASLIINMKIFVLKPLTYSFGKSVLLNADVLASLILIALPFFALAALIFAFGFFKGVKLPSINYYPYLLMTLGASVGAVLSNNLILLLIFWGFLGLTLYLMIDKGDEDSAKAAKKSFIIVGGTDSLLILGVAIIYFVSGSFDMNKINLNFSVLLSVIAYLCIMSAAFAKAGAIPFHTWIPDAAQKAPVPTVMYLPASLDKLLGIYLIARCSLDLFKMSNGMNTFLMCIGALTIITAVMMALIQHDLKALLGYHAVSQVGYMILGIGTGSVIGIAGGIFHMVNNAVYKSALFLTSGVVEKQAGTTDLDKLGGLAKSMPISFLVCIIAVMSISGVPPFNGFFSKWMVYQGLVEVGKDAKGFGDMLWVVWLVLAMFGSALTLASFLKVLHAVFLGRDSGLGKIKEASSLMLIPMVVLALLCVSLGIGANKFLNTFIFPALPAGSYIGFWSPTVATVLIIAGLVLGFILYLFGNIKNIRRDSAYYGGEKLSIDERITGTDFYNSIREYPIINRIYKMAEAKLFDIYDQGKTWIFSVGKVFQRLHSGIIHNYVSWCLLGILLMIIYKLLQK
ncbi:MAG: proton-conducting transporter membrane subunit [bacterium]